MPPHWSNECVPSCPSGVAKKAMHYRIQFAEGLKTSLAAIAKELLRLDFPADLVEVLQHGQTRPLTDQERNELRHYIEEK